MKEMSDFLAALLEEELEEGSEEIFENNNDDYDLGAVFSFCCDECTPHEVRFPDGSIGRFDFD